MWEAGCSVFAILYTSSSFAFLRVSEHSVSSISTDSAIVEAVFVEHPISLASNTILCHKQVLCLKPASGKASRFYVFLVFPLPEGYRINPISKIAHPRCCTGLTVRTKCEYRRFRCPLGVRKYNRESTNASSCSMDRDRRASVMLSLLWVELSLRVVIHYETSLCQGWLLSYPMC